MDGRLGGILDAQLAQLGELLDAAGDLKLDTSRPGVLPRFEPGRREVRRLGEDLANHGEVLGEVGLLGDERPSDGDEVAFEVVAGDPAADVGDEPVGDLGGAGFEERTNTKSWGLQSKWL